MHYIALLFCVLMIVLYNAYDLLLYGSWTIPVFVIIMFFTGVFYHLFSANVYANKADRLYFTGFSRLPFLSLLMIFFPFLGLVIVVSLVGGFMVPETTYYSDDKIVIQSQANGALAAKTIRILIRKRVFNEIVYSDKSEYNTDSITVDYSKQDANIYFYQLGNEGKLQLADTLKVNLKLDGW